MLNAYLKYYSIKDICKLSAGKQNLLVHNIRMSTCTRFVCSTIYDIWHYNIVSPRDNQSTSNK